MSSGINGFGAANLINNKNDKIHKEFNRAERWAKHARGLQDDLDNLSSRFNALSSRNDRLESLIRGMTNQGVASEALATIHALKAEALQKQADQEDWSKERRREANLKLFAEAEYDYRLKNDPTYRLNTCATALMSIATYSDNADAIRKVVGQMSATGKVRKGEEKDRLIAERIESMKAIVKYPHELATIPTQESLPVMDLEMYAEYEDSNKLTSLGSDEPTWIGVNKIKPRL